jgi:aspartyl-tRNA(Asn)/glutamyl-tRNA(Gln) amidotransferase subunit C
MISEKEVKHVALLARLGLADEEIKKMERDMSAILDYIEKLKEVDISKVNIDEAGKGHRNVMRKDEPMPAPEERVKRLIESMPEQKNGYLKVKQVF